MITGIIVAVLYAGSMACLNLTVKYVDADTTTIMFIRYNVAFLFTLPFIKYLFQRNCSLYWHIARGISIFIINFFTYYGHKHSSFITANVIGLTEPLFVLGFSIIMGTTLLQPIFAKIHTKNPLTKSMMIGLTCGYIGVLTILLSKPTTHTITGTVLGTLSILLANILAAMFVFLSKYLTKHEKVPTLVMYTTLVLWLCGWIIKPSNEVLLSITFDQWKLLILIGFIGITGHFLAMFALSKLPAEKYSPLLYSRILFGLGLGYIFFGEIITIIQFLSGLLIITGLYIINKSKGKV